MTLPRQALIAALGAALLTTTAWSAPLGGADRGRHAGKAAGQGGQNARIAPAPRPQGTAPGQGRPKQIDSPRDAASGHATSLVSPRDPQSGLPTGQ